MRAHSLTPLLCLVAACGRNEPAPLPPVDRVVIAMDGVRATSQLPDPTTPSWAIEGTWAVSDVRDAYVVELGTPIETRLPLAGPLDLTCAIALQVPAGADRDDLVVECELRLVSKSRDQVLVTHKSTLHDAAHGWIELHEQTMVRPEEEARVVVKLSAPLAPPGVKACITPPRAADTRRFESKPNLLVISFDALRADRMQSQGCPRETTPRIDTLLARGTRFQHAVSIAPWTLPSYGTLFTGLSPCRHRAGVSPSREANFEKGTAVEPGDMELLDPSVETIAARLARAGYRTGGFVSNPFLDHELGIDRGFERWTMYTNRASAGTELATSWIRTQGSAPWFCFLHVMDPHGPYTPPAPFDQQFAGVSVSQLAGYPPPFDTLRTAQIDAPTKKTLMDLYDAEIASADAAIGKLIEFLDAAGLSNQTLIVFHSDHGEEFWEHGGYEHGHAVHEEVVRVPLAFVLPGRVPENKFVTTPVSTLDACPTVLEVLGQGMPTDGLSLVPHFGAQVLPPRDIESGWLLYGDRERKALVSGGLKLITDGRTQHQLYDLAADPGEQNDLSVARPGDVKILRERLEARVQECRARARTGVKATLSSGQRRAIEKLGYPSPDTPR